MILTGASQDEIKRERARLSQVRHRKKKKALAEGKPEDFYITDEDFYQDAASFDPPERPVRRSESASATQPARSTRAATPPPLSQADLPLLGKVLWGIVYLAIFVLYLAYLSSRDRRGG